MPVPHSSPRASPCPMAKRQTDLASSLTAAREATSSSSSVVATHDSASDNNLNRHSAKLGPDSRASPIVAIVITTVTQRKPDSSTTQALWLGRWAPKWSKAPSRCPIAAFSKMTLERCDRINQQRCCKCPKILASSYRNAAGALLREFGRSKSEFPVFFFSLLDAARRRRTGCQ